MALGIGQNLDLSTKLDQIQNSREEFNGAVGASTPSMTTGDGLYVPAYNPTYVSPYRYGDTAAQDTRAEIARAEWRDYKARFKPIEDMLINNVGGDSRFTQSLGKANEALGQQYGMADGTFQRNNSRYGVSMSGTQQAQHKQRLGLSKAVAEANLRNSTRKNVADSNMALMSGMGAPKEEMA